MLSTHSCQAPLTSMPSALTGVHLLHMCWCLPQRACPCRIKYADLAADLLQNDSIEGIYDTLKECAGISKSAGGIGLSIHNIRATGSYIRGTNGTSNGIVPMLRVFNDTARYVDQVGCCSGSLLSPCHSTATVILPLRPDMCAAACLPGC